MASNAREAMERLASESFSLVILDINLPDQSGFEVFTEMQAHKNYKSTPVIFLTAQSEISSKIAAFSMGAEDYIVKPFNALELKARVEAKLRRADSLARSNVSLCKGQLQLDASTQRAYSLEGAEPRAIHLTPREFNLLFFLAKNEEHVLTRAQLLDAVWGGSGEVFDRAVDTHISAIRRKLGSLSGYIQSVPGAGYRFSCLKHSQSGSKAA
ncbi:unnamed protein product [Sphagnum jensenii]|uniref:OmpR-like protein n=1 Tax=Sphagnum jensenii TaxID=128206 RepID=A0ABP0V848_9BRYO